MYDSNKESIRKIINGINVKRVEPNWYQFRAKYLNY